MFCSNTCWSGQKVIIVKPTTFCWNALLYAYIMTGTSEMLPMQERLSAAGVYAEAHSHAPGVVSVLLHTPFANVLHGSSLLLHTDPSSSKIIMKNWYYYKWIVDKLINTQSEKQRVHDEIFVNIILSVMKKVWTYSKTLLNANPYSVTTPLFKEAFRDKESFFFN